MVFAFPRFNEPSAVDAQRAWTATFDSYDQRNDDIYYVVTIREERREVARFMVHVWPYWAGEDWTAPGFVECLHREIHKVALTGTTNTGYTGAMASWPEP